MTFQAGFSDGSGGDVVLDADAPDGGKMVAVTNWGCSCCKNDTTAEQTARAVWLARLIEQSGETEPSDHDKIRGAWLVTDHARGWS